MNHPLSLCGRKFPIGWPLFLGAFLCYFGPSLFPTTSLAIEGDKIPSVGLSYGEGESSEGGTNQRAGFTSERLRDDSFSGTVSLMLEQQSGGIPFTLRDPHQNRNTVDLRYQTAYMEIKRYFPLHPIVHYYWGIRGGYTRLRGRTEKPDSNFEQSQIAPFLPLALPLMLEHPGYLILAFVDGTSTGLSVDIVPSKMWIDYQIGTQALPFFENQTLRIDKKFLITQTLTISLLF